MCTGKVGSPVGTGIGSSRSLVCGIAASGPESLLVSEAWEMRKTAIYSPRLIIPGHKNPGLCTASQSTASVGIASSTVPELQGPFCSWSLLTLGSKWLVDTCFVLDEAVVILAKHKAVFQILCLCLFHTASFHEACLLGLDSQLQEDVG